MKKKKKKKPRKNEKKRKRIKIQESRGLGRQEQQRDRAVFNSPPSSTTSLPALDLGSSSPRLCARPPSATPSAVSGLHAPSSIHLPGRKEDLTRLTEVSE